MTMPSRCTLFLAVAVLGILGPAPRALAGPSGGREPIGRLDSFSVRFAGYRENGPITGTATGWAADPDAPGSPITIHFYVDGVFVAQAATGAVARPDVAAAFPWAGPNAGFATPLDLATGHTLCAYAINVGAGSSNTTLGCHSVVGPDAGDPVGRLDTVAPRPGAVRVAGWAVDPDWPAGPLSMRVFVDGAPITSIEASTARPDVHQAFPAYSANSGYDRVIPVLPGHHQICLSAENVGPNGLANTSFGCPLVDVADVGPTGAHDPRGSLDAAWFTVVATGYFPTHLTGWAFDPDTAGPWSVLIRWTQSGSNPAEIWPTLERRWSTGVARPDVEAAFPQAGPTAGWSAEIDWPAKYVTPRYVCAYAIGTGPGAGEVFLGCRTHLAVGQ